MDGWMEVIDLDIFNNTLNTFYLTIVFCEKYFYEKKTSNESVKKIDFKITMGQ